MRAFHIACAIASAVVTASAANAAYQINTITLDKANPLWGTVNPGPGGPAANVYVGRLKLSGVDLSATPAANIDFLTYCIDVMHWLSPGLFEVKEITDPTIPYPSLTVNKINRLTALMQHGNPLVTNATNSAAMQLAIWEVVFENSTIASGPLAGQANYGFGGGTFTASGGTLGNGGTASAVSLAGTYLANLNNGTWTASANSRLKVLVGQSGSNQTQLLALVTAVPEPTSWGMMILGFGLIGVHARRRRHTARSAIA